MTIIKIQQGKTNIDSHSILWR